MENQNQDLDRKKIVDFCGKNIRYIAAGVILIILVIVLAVTVAGANKNKEGQKEENVAGEEIPQDTEKDQEAENKPEEFAVDAIPEINTLMQNYYTAYASGDTAALEACVTPLTDLEKSYIGIMSQYATGYENIHCYTKKGLADGEYAVSVTSDMRFEGIENTAPGLSFFYIRTNESGAYYIDNVYSPFNLEKREVTLDSQMESFIAEYEAQEDVAKLASDTQVKYEAALTADEALNTMITQTIPQALRDGSGNPEEEAKEPSENPEEGSQEPKDDQTEEPKEPEGGQEDGNQAPEEEQQEPEADQNTSETVYAISNINIRKEAREDSDKVGSALIGQSFTRTGTTEDGWSAIEFDGGKAYIKSEYLSTEKPEVPEGEEPQQTEENNGDNGGVNYVPEGKTLTLNNAMNIRKSMNEDAEKVGTAAPGDTITVILSYKEGWTKVEWNGTTGYIRTDLLLNN